MPRWPHDDMQSLVAFYGDPNDANFHSEQIVRIMPPWQLFYAGRPWTHGIEVHRKCASALSAALQEIWEHAGRTQAAIDACGLSNFSGSYVNRDVRGHPGVKSVHAFGAAFDFDAEHNPLGATRGAMPSEAVASFKHQEGTWGGDFVHRKDWMHFQFAYEGTWAAPKAAPAEPAPEPQDARDEEDRDAPATPFYKKPVVIGSALGGATGSGSALDAANQASDVLNTVNNIKDGVHQTGIIELGLKLIDTHPRFMFMATFAVLALVGVIALVATHFWRKK